MQVSITFKAISVCESCHSNRLTLSYSCSVLGAWWEVDLGEGVAVKSVKIYNRVDCCTERLTNSLVLLKDNQGNIVKSYRIGDATGKAVFTFEVDPCNELLQQFHRFDEELSVQGKWQGGSVTGVCKGWGTNKVGLGFIFFQQIDAIIERNASQHCICYLVSITPLYV